MILMFDVGNTNMVVGLHNGKKLVTTWRFSSGLERTADEYYMLLSIALKEEQIGWDMIEDMIVSSVVPSMNMPLEWLGIRAIGKKPIMVGAGIKTGLHIKLNQPPQSTGSDLISTAVAAFHKYGGPTVVVDFGTATTMMVVNEKAEYLGGAITPGINLASQSLFSKAALIPNIPLEQPDHAIGKNTIEAVQSGIIFGYAGLVDGIVGRIKKELDLPAKVVATGGQAQFIAHHAESIEIIDEHLMFDGLKIIYDLNKR